MERDRIVHNRQYQNRSLCGVILTPYAVISNDINKISCTECRKIAKAWEEQRYVVKGLRLVK